MKTSTVLYLSLSRPLDREIGLPVGQELVAAAGAHCTNPSGDVKHCCRAGSGSPGSLFFKPANHCLAVWLGETSLGL